MSNVQAKALKLWAFILWSALFCGLYLYGAGDSFLGENRLLFCLSAWSLPWAIGLLWRATQKQKQRHLANGLTK